MSAGDLPTEGEVSPTLGGLVVRVRDGWIVAVVPMIFNDRVVLCDARSWRHSYVAGWCYPKGPAAALAALAWDERTEREPAGYAKRAVDARPIWQGVRHR